MIQNFTYFDVHTHKKYKEESVGFIRNAFHHLSINQLNNLPYSFSVGLHPWDVHQNFKTSLENIEIISNHKNCVAVGEIGLDYFIKTDRELQKIVFIEQMDLAKNSNKPVIVHCVRAYHDLQPIIKKYSSIPIILHHYNGNEQTTQSLLMDNVFFSFGRQLFNTNFNTEVFNIIPSDKILLETDNSALHIEDVYLRAAKMLDIDLSELIVNIKKNVSAIF